MNRKLIDLPGDTFKEKIILANQLRVATQAELEKINCHLCLNEIFTNGSNPSEEHFVGRYNNGCLQITRPEYIPELSQSKKNK